METISLAHTQWDLAARDWAELHQSSGASFFLNPAWVETWLEVYGPLLRPRILLFRQGSAAVGACLLVRKTVRRKFMPVRRVFLNCAGEPEADETGIEYNRLMCAPGEESAVATALRAQLARTAWDELALEGVEQQVGIEALSARSLRTDVVRRPSWYVDLGSLRAAGDTYESVLSGDLRKQIRRSVRLYEEASGPVRLQLAVGDQEPGNYFSELSALHQKSWAARGKSGAFASGLFLRFHQRLIQRAHGQGNVLLMRAAAGESPIGLLYCFFDRGRVYFYQSGFSYSGDNRLKPGFVSHFLAVNHLLATKPDAMEYDFLAGDSQYKKSLGQHHRMLEWILIKQPTLRERAIEALKYLRRR